MDFALKTMKIPVAQRHVRATLYCGPERCATYQPFQGCIPAAFRLILTDCFDCFRLTCTAAEIKVSASAHRGGIPRPEVSKNEEFCIKHVEFCIKNEEL